MRSTLIISLCTLLGASAPLAAGTIHVPGDHPTIQAALDAAVTGDEVVLADGVYTGAGNRDLDFGGKDLVLRSASGDPSLCTIDCEALGRALIFQSGETPASRVEGITVANGVATSGGGVRVSGPTTGPTFADCVFVGCHATDGPGGAVYNNASAPGGSMQLTNCTFEANTVTFDFPAGGGAIRTSRDLTLIDCTFTGNETFGFGENDARGGAIDFSGSVLTIDGGVFTGNSAHDAGGAVLFDGQVSLVVHAVTFSGNTSTTSDGGAVRLSSNATATFDGCVFDENAADESGGALSLGNGSLATTAVRSCDFTDNTAGQSGGAISTSSAVLISGCLIRGNQATQSGGGLRTTNSSATIVGCRLLANTSGNDGGALALHGDEHTVVNCLISGNLAADLGGGVYAPNADAHRILDCTIVGNTAGGSGGGVRFGNSPVEIVANCIVRGNSGAQLQSNGAPDVTHCNVEGGFTGTNNIDLDPGFADASAGDYRLIAGSPCVDAGLNDARPADVADVDDDGDVDEPIPLDLDGVARLQSCRVDMGAFESAFVGDTDFDGYTNCEEDAATDDPDGDGIPNYIDEDSDGDGVPDATDMCPLDDPDDSDFDGYCDSNDICPGGDDDEDFDGDGVPDACDDDADGDGVPNDEDACPEFDDAIDADGDGQPDACDPCPDIPGNDDEDFDGDGVPDACDDDVDGDGVPNDVDACPEFDDAIDFDGDGVPDACDDDADGDGVPNDVDACPGFDDAIDADGDGIPDACDGDVDGDGTPNETDICPGFDDAVDTDGDGVPDGCDLCPGSDDASDLDGDGVPDGCDDDVDGDGAPNETDLCPGFDDTVDTDGDGVPDGCDVCPGGDDDADADGDGVADACDACPGFPDGEDLDGDGTPDGCDPDRVVNVTTGATHATIQDALLAALDGNEIVVLPGTFAESIDLLGRAVHLRSAAGPAATIIDASSTSDRVVRCDGGEELDTILEGFTLTGGSGVLSGGGLLVSQGSTLTVRDCVFAGNDATSEGGAVAVISVSTAPRFEGCVFTANTSVDGGAVYAEDDATFVECRFEENAASGDGGAIHDAVGALRVVRTAFVDNEASEGGAIFTRNSTCRIAGCRFESNYAQTRGGAIRSASTIADQHAVEVINCTFHDDFAELTSEAIHHGDGAMLVASCSFGEDGSAVVHLSIRFEGGDELPAELVVVNSILWDDIAIHDGSGPLGSIEVRYCNVRHGFAGTGNIEAEPLFLDDALRLRFDSPCRNAGDAAELPPDLLDLDGDGDTSEPLPLDGDFLARVSEGQVDMGAFEIRFDGDDDVDAGETVVLQPGGGAPTESSAIEFTNTSGIDDASVEALETPANLHPNAFGLAAAGTTLTFETTLADGEFLMTLSVPFALADLDGGDPLAVDLAYYDVPSEAWELAVAANTEDSPGHAGPIGDRFVQVAPEAPAVGGDLGDYGVYYDPAAQAGFAWATVDHATDFAAAFGVPCPGDLDGDGNRGFADLIGLLAAWGATGSPADLDMDGTVGLGDLLLLLASWGGCP